MEAQKTALSETRKESAQHRDALVADALNKRSKRSSSRLRVDTSKLFESSCIKDDSQFEQATDCNDGDIAAIGQRIRTLSLNADRARAEFLEAIARFDELEGWRATGARSCAAWMISELGLCRTTAYREWKCARELRELPVIAAHFAEGKLNWCKVRALLRVATPAEDHALALLAVDRSADEVQNLCDDYHFGKDPESDAERDRAQRERRSVTYSRCADGSLAIHVVLPPVDGAVLVRALEHREENLPSRASLNKDASESQHMPDTSDTAQERAAPENSPRVTATQRRADALVAVAHASLGGASTSSDNPSDDGSGLGAATAERHMVITHIDVDALVAAESQVASESLETNKPLPTPLRAAIAGITGGSISPATARRLACQSSLVTMIIENGEPIAVGRKHRLHTAAQRRAILARDGGRCTFPGCGATRHLDVHHMTLWSEGGDTSVRNGVTLCSACHTRVHDEGWKITRLSNKKCTTPRVETEAHTLQVVNALEKQRSRFRFECPGATGLATDPAAGLAAGPAYDSAGEPAIECGKHSTNCCAEPRQSYALPHSYTIALKLRPPAHRSHRQQRLQRQHLQ